MCFFIQQHQQPIYYQNSHNVSPTEGYVCMVMLVTTTCNYRWSNRQSDFIILNIPSFKNKYCFTT